MAAGPDDAFSFTWCHCSRRKMAALTNFRGKKSPAYSLGTTFLFSLFSDLEEVPAPHSSAQLHTALDLIRTSEGIEFSRSEVWGHRPTICSSWLRKWKKVKYHTFFAFHLAHSCLAPGLLIPSFCGSTQQPLALQQFTLFSMCLLMLCVSSEDWFWIRDCFSSFT